jgi:hypothetical protein
MGTIKSGPLRKSTVGCAAEFTAAQKIPERSRDRQGVGMARRATYGDESGRSVVGQTFSLQTGFSRSLRRVLRGLSPAQNEFCPTTQAVTFA